MSIFGITLPAGHRGLITSLMVAAALSTIPIQSNAMTSCIDSFKVLGRSIDSSGPVVVEHYGMYDCPSLNLLLFDRLGDRCIYMSLNLFDWSEDMPTDCRMPISTRALDSVQVLVRPTFDSTADSILRNLHFLQDGRYDEIAVVLDSMMEAPIQFYSTQRNPATLLWKFEKGVYQNCNYLSQFYDKKSGLLFVTTQSPYYDFLGHGNYEGLLVFQFEPEKRKSPSTSPPPRE